MTTVEQRGDWMQTFTGRTFYPLAPAAAIYGGTPHGARQF